MSHAAAPSPPWLAPLIVVAAAALACLPAPAGVAPAIMPAAGLVLGAILLYATQALPEYVTSLAFIALAAALGLAPPQVAFAGFHASVLWLLFAGIVIGLALTHTGLAARLAGALLARGAGSFERAALTVLLAAIALSFAMPATMARMVLLVPVVLALADQLGYEPGSRGRIGLACAGVFGVYMPSYAILPANLPNVVLVGAVEALYGVSVSYGEYLLWLFPTVGLLKAVAIYALVLYWYRSPLPPRPATLVAAPGPLDGAQARLAWIMGLTVLLWATDFLHHVSPGWVALGAAALLLVPRLGLLPARPFAGKLDLSTVFYVGGVLGVGAVAVETGLGALIAGRLIEWIGLEPDAPGRNFAALVLASTLLGQSMTSPAATSILAAMTQELADASGLAMQALMMTELLGLSTIWLPYAAPPVVVGLAVSGIPLREGIRFLLAMGLVSMLLVAPASYVLWRALGLI